MTLMAPTLFYALYMSSLYSRNAKFSASLNMFFTIGGTGFIAYHLFKLIKLTNLRRSYRLGYEGEIAVGQELNQLSFKVSYDGNRLHFPKGTDIKFIQQAKGQAAWLSKWLKNVLGEAVVVRPVLAVPGWFIERTSSNGIAVINPKNFRSIAKPKNGKTLSDQMIKRIVHQPEQKCRDVEPKARD
jgi:hypothetical protein